MQQTPFHAYYTARILGSLSDDDGFVPAFASFDIKIYPFQIAAAKFSQVQAEEIDQIKHKSKAKKTVFTRNLDALDRQIKATEAERETITSYR
mgnify:CR=1 FL=1